MESSFSLRSLEFDKITDQIALYAMTESAAEKISRLAPLDNADDIQHQLDMTEEMQALLTYDDPFPLNSLFEIRPYLKKISVPGIFLNPEELKKLLNTLETIRKTQSYIAQRKLKYQLLNALVSAITPYQPIEKAISRSVDDQGAIRDEASPALRQIRRDITASASKVRKKIENLSRQFTDEGMTADTVVTLREGRMVIPVKEQHKNTIRGFIHDVSSSGQTVFIEPVEVLEMNNELRRLQISETKEIERILTELSNQIRERLDDLRRDTEIISDLEVIFAKASFTGSLQANKPALNAKGYVHLVNAKHPLLLVKESQKNPDERKPVVPLNLSLGQSESDDRIMIISGPNAGGKTVALKTVGLLTLMAQAGLLIPADIGSSVAVFKKILVDIGDDQSIENDLSTFSSHIRNIADMARRVDRHTLILIDEIGSSTSPKEGASLAISALEYFNEKEARAIVTTHHGELKVFAQQAKGVINGSMEFDQETLEPTYVFRSGIPGSSYAFDIAKRMGLSREIIGRARELTGRETHQLEQLINDLQKRTSEYEHRIAEINREKLQLEGLQKMYDEKLVQLKNEEKTYRKKLLVEKEEFLRRARKETEEAIALLKQSQGVKSAVQDARQTLKDKQSEIDAESKELLQRHDLEKIGAGELRSGMKVFIPSMEMEGTVLSEKDESGLVLIGVGALKMRLSADHLAKISKPAEVRTEIPRQNVDWDTNGIRNEIDLRGLTVDEGIAKTDEFLTNAIVMGFREVTLIHGKGSGALRKGLSLYLKADRRVISSRLGQWGEGDTGVTVVTLRLD